MRSTRERMARAQSLMSSWAARDDRAATMRAVREGRFDDVAADAFNEDWPAPVVANRIDTMARDAQATLSPLPSFNCVPSNTMSDSARAFASKRSQIVQGYVESSNLQAQMPDAVDAYKSYGLIAFHVEPDFKAKMPRIRQVDGSTCYAVWDKDFRTVEFARASWVTKAQIEALYPDRAQNIFEAARQGYSPERIKVVHYEDKDSVLVFLPELSNAVISDTPNLLGRCSYVAAPRPSGQGTWHAVPTGAYDGLVWPLLAANEFRMLALEAVDKSIRAPIVAPLDVTDVSMGADSILRTNNPQGVQKLRLDVPPSVFTASSLLDQDIQVGGMSPGSRTGNISASVITGRGVDALGEGYSQQIAMDQQRIAWALEQVIQICFEMDEKFWPNAEKEVRGRRADNPFSIKYKPSRDIHGDHSVSVDYGFLLGLDPNRALVFILQAQGSGLISNSTAAQYLPISLNLDEEARQIKLEQMRNSLVQAYSALAQNLPAMIAGGQDASPVIRAVALVIEGIKKGQEIEKITADVFAPPKQEPSQPAPQDQAAAGPAGFGPESGLTPNLATEGPNARPDLQMMFAGITASGKPNLAATVSRMQPVAGQ